MTLRKNPSTCLLSPARRTAAVAWSSPFRLRPWNQSTFRRAFRPWRSSSSIAWPWDPASSSTRPTTSLTGRDKASPDNSWATEEEKFSSPNRASLWTEVRSVGWLTAPRTAKFRCSLDFWPENLLSSGAKFRRKSCKPPFSISCAPFLDLGLASRPDSSSRIGRTIISFTGHLRRIRRLGRCSRITLCDSLSDQFTLQERKQLFSKFKSNFQTSKITVS